LNVAQVVLKLHEKVSYRRQTVTREIFVQIKHEEEFMERVKIFLLGVLTAVGIMLLMGSDAADQVGRYRLESVAPSLGYGVFIIDTKTGVTKQVYAKWADGQVVNYLNKPFVEIPGK
jgi:hypothetical protein